LCALAPGVAQADSAKPDAALAETLFQEGRRLMTAGHYAEACPKFAESHRLDSRSGTLLNLAACHEHEGKIATAWAEFNDAVSLAQRDARPDREKFARERIQALEPRLSRVRIVVSPQAEADQPEITLDGLAVGRAVLGIATPLDPGEHLITASAPGRQRWEVRLVVREAESKVVEVPALTPISQTVPNAVVPISAPAPYREQRASNMPYVYVLGGVGIASLAVGTIFGVRAVSKRSDAEALCSGSRCTRQAVELNDDAKTAAWIANAGVGVGIVTLGVAGYLWITNPKQEASGAKQTTLLALPIVERHGGGAMLEGHF
jgi:hypothetical protein